MAGLIFPTASAVIALNEEVLGRPGALTDEGKLEGALYRARMVEHYQGGDVGLHAAYVIAGVALAHAFADGNKRTALYAANLFLVRNGWQFPQGYDYLPLARLIERYVEVDEALREGLLMDLATSILDGIVVKP